MKSIFIIEDEVLVLSSIEQTLLNNNYSVVGKATNYLEAKRKINLTKADLILCDINLNSEKTGLDLMREVESKRGIPFIFISAYTDDKTINEVDKLSPFNFISKPFTEKQLLVTLKRFFASRVIHETITPTGREKMILKLVAQGKNTKKIAEELTVSFNTVETHRKNMLRKFSAKTMAELIAIAANHKWI